MTPEKLKDLMHEHRLNRKGVAALVGVTDRAVTHWLLGKHPMRQQVWEYLLFKLEKQTSIVISGSTWSLKR